MDKTVTILLHPRKKRKEKKRKEKKRKEKKRKEKKNFANLIPSRRPRLQHPAHPRHPILDQTSNPVRDSGHGFEGPKRLWTAT